MAPISKPQTKSLKSFTFPWLAGMIKTFLQPSPFKLHLMIETATPPMGFRNPPSPKPVRSLLEVAGRERSQNHTLVWVGRDLKDLRVPTPCHGAGTPFTSLDQRTLIKGE